MRCAESQVYYGILTLLNKFVIARERSDRGNPSFLTEHTDSHASVRTGSE